MAITIKPLENDCYLVNKKVTFLNMDNKWESKSPLSTEEQEALFSYMHSELPEKKSDFKKKHFDLEPKTKLKLIDQLINKINLQRDILDSGKDLFSEEKIILRKYYQKKVKKYYEMRDQIINNFPVTYQVVETNAPTPSV